MERRIERDENEFSRTLSFFDATFALSTVLYLIARHDGLFRHPPTDDETRLAIIDRSVSTVVFLVSIPVAVLVSGSAGRWCWLSLVVLGPLVGRRTDRRRRRERRLLGPAEDG